MRILVWFIFFSSFVAMAQKTTSKHHEAAQNLVTSIIQLQSKNQIKTPDFSYTFYEKSIISANPDSISASIDSVFKNKRKTKFIIDSSSYKFKKIITIEDGCLMGGFGSAVLEFMVDQKYQAEVIRLGIPDEYIHHGTQEELWADCGFDTSSIIRTISTIFKLDQEKIAQQNVG